MKTPTSIKFIAGFLIITSLISVIMLFVSYNNPLTQELMAKSPLPIPVQLGMAVLGLAVIIISGIGMLKAKNWARWLYIGWTLFGTTVTLLTSPMRMMVIPSLVIFAIFTFLLFRPNNNAYFAQGKINA